MFPRDFDISTEMKRYAELIGNYKKYWIKSQYGNKLDAPDSLAGLITNVLGNRRGPVVKIADISILGY